MKWVYLVIRLIAALIMLQTLYFKFSGSEESVYIFTMVKMEPWGRFMVGAFELIASILILIPSTVWIGAILTIGIMLGAIVMHLTLLGIEVMDDGGYLFMLSVVVFICGVILLLKERDKALTMIRKLT